MLHRALEARRRRLPGGGRKVQIARRCVQVAVLLLLCLIPVLALYDNLRAQRDETGIRDGLGTRAVHGAIGDSPRLQQAARNVRGNLWTMKLGAQVISDPLAALDFATASRLPWHPFLLTALIPVLLTLLLGRVFCGWICPADLLFEAGSVVRRWARIRGDITFSRLTKFAVLAAGAAGAAWAGSQVFAGVYPPRLVGGELYSLICGGAMGGGAWFLLALLALEIFASRRLFCRHVCPGGALYSLLGAWRVLRLKVSKRRCTRCKGCNRACELGLEPMEGSFGLECNNCGQCVRACPAHALVWRLGARPAGGRDILEEPDGLEEA